MGSSKTVIMAAGHNDCWRARTVRNCLVPGKIWKVSRDVPSLEVNWVETVH